MVYGFVCTPFFVWMVKQMSKKNTESKINILLKAYTDYDYDQYLYLCDKINHFTETLNENQKEEFGEIYFLALEYLHQERINNRNYGFDEGKAQTELKYKRSKHL